VPYPLPTYNIQHERPDVGTSNWLPAPAQEFNMAMRLYLPEEKFLKGEWKIPAVEKIKR
jgi:hypothetical protein